jgi:hypothetical protein
MVGTTRQRAAAVVAANDLTSVKKQIFKQCIETAISAANRVCEFRKREIDTLIDNYVNIIPVDVRETRLSQL